MAPLPTLCPPGGWLLSFQASPSLSSCAPHARGPHPKEAPLRWWVHVLPPLTCRARSLSLWAFLHEHMADILFYDYVGVKRNRRQKFRIWLIWKVEHFRDPPLLRPWPPHLLTASFSNRAVLTPLSPLTPAPSTGRAERTVRWRRRMSQ